MNIRDAEDASMLGDLDFEDFIQGFDLEWNAPLLESMAAVILTNLPEEPVAELEKMSPEAMERMRLSMKGGLDGR